tara:strand:+ start:751 stop:1941 length:1191 start_codon:yes stop_codon:yes gene_type:complete
MSVINTNITSMIGQQNLSKSQNALTTSMERLSSGLRINSAKDDAAGQAIANRMSSQITGLSQAQRNANDGISVAQTAEGALNQVNDNLQRVRELAVQASNDTNSAEDRSSIQAEINQRLAEIDRISAQTDFNGTKVLASDQQLSIQVGANDSETITIDLEEITSSTLNLSSFNVAGPDGTPGAATASNYQDAYGTTTDVNNASVVDDDVELAARLGVSSGSVAFTTDDAFVDASGNWYAKIEISANSTAEANNLANNGFDIANGATSTFFVALEPTEATTSAGNSTAAFDLDVANLDLAAISQERTSNPMAALDTALGTVDSLRSDLGAIQNRFESAITNLQTNETNLSAARSRIEDADYATEVANMTRAQILQQAGTSVLAQANQIPQNVLSLLG